ncbi:MAG: GGDEF domain-containing protein, partial [Anaerolineales bacterium]
RLLSKDQVELERVQPERESRHYDELTKLNNELVTLQRDLIRKNIELERLNAEVQRLAITDSLTGLYNRRGFFELSHREVERAKRFDHFFSIIILDIDHFKEINDTHGHETGDLVLEKVARRLGAQLRKVDILGRYGGEEFALLLPETSGTGARVVAERLRGCITAEPIETSQGSLNVTISLGLAALTVNTMTLEDLLRRADQALYKAKESGRNCVCVYDELSSA